MDRSLIILAAVFVMSLASAALWHWLVKSYPWAVTGSTFTVGLATDLLYPLLRGVAPDPFILANALILGAVCAVGVGIPFKRLRPEKGPSPLP